MFAPLHDFYSVGSFCLVKIWQFLEVVNLKFVIGLRFTPILEVREANFICNKDGLREILKMECVPLSSV